MNKETEDKIVALRTEIDSLDAELLKLIDQRLKISRRVLELKSEIDLELRDIEREEEIRRKAEKTAKELSLNVQLAQELLQQLIDESLQGYLKQL